MRVATRWPNLFVLEKFFYQPRMPSQAATSARSLNAPLLQAGRGAPVTLSAIAKKKPTADAAGFFLLTQKADKAKCVLSENKA